jgi:tetratricopeptide (TPR) repeat protein
MLKYFIRVDKLREVLPLKNRFLAMKTKPLAASTMAELGGYLLDKGEMPDVLRILKEALGKDQLHPETHYQLGRYYRRSGNDAEETKALDNSIAGFRRLPALGKRNLVMYLEDLVRRGDLRLARKEYFTAEDDFGAAVVEYERALDLHRLEKNPAFGKAYAGLGEVSYWGKEDLDGALAYYERAAANAWDSPEIRYKRGFIDYRRGRIADALTQFYLAGRDGDGNPYLLYSFGNALLERADFHAAEGYYRRVVETMTDAFDALDYPIPQEKRTDRAIVELLMESQNNLGVALFRIGDRMGNAKLRADAAAAFTESARLFDILVHDSRSLLAADAMNLGYLNLDYALHPRRGIDLGSYKPIPKDMTWPLN